MLKRALVVSLLGAVFAADASAGTITHSGVPSIPGREVFILEENPDQGTFTVTRWDPAAYPGQTLANVSITLQASFRLVEQVRITANIGPGDLRGPVPFTYDSFASTSLMLPDSTPLVSLALQSSTSIVRISWNWASEKDEEMKQVVEANLSGSQAVEFTGDLSAFFGAGDLVMPINAEGRVTIPPQNFDLGTVYPMGLVGINPLGGRASVSVTYSWVPVPEPSSFVLAALGLIGLAACAWRRKGSR